MIEHLRGREKALEPFGWTGREAEWIALVCLHSGAFTRAQFCFYFDANRMNALRFVKRLVDRGTAVEPVSPIFSGGSRACRISSKPIYRALGVENIRHRRRTSTNGMMRRLLSLDYVLEHPHLPWLPTEPEKVQCFEALGIERGLMPHRIYHGAVRKQKRYFALKLPVAVDSETATFTYADPGNETDTGLRSWGAAHGRLWAAIREKGLQVRVAAIAGNHEPVERAEGLLRAWASNAPEKPVGGLTVKEEIARIREALGSEDEDVLAEYGGFNAALQHSVKLQDLPEASAAGGVSIDGFATWRASRFAGIENEFVNGGEDG